MVKITLEKPEGFSPNMEVAGVSLFVQDKMLILQYSDFKNYPGTWGIPAGKVEPQEDLHLAAARELFEETGIVVDSAKLEPAPTFYVQKPHVEYSFHSFFFYLESFPEVRISAEHQNYAFVTLEELFKMPIIDGGIEILKTLYIKK